MDKFQNKRNGSTGNYIYLAAGMERRQKLPKQFSLFLKLDGQIADQPLINNEQYSAGGVGSVRGYKESEIMADNALHGTIELFAPDLLKTHVLIPYLFYDFACLDVREPLAGEIDGDFIHGAGIGLTGNWKETIDFKLDLGFALEETDDTKSGDVELHFKTAIRF
jgi:hemolysin activation/secretion protein